MAKKTKTGKVKKVAKKQVEEEEAPPAEVAIVSDSEAESGDESDYSDLEEETPLSNAQLKELDVIALETNDKIEKKIQKPRNRKGEFKQIREAARGVIYLGHLPDGFTERTLRKFFGQFGKVTRWRLAKNKKTGRTRHYGFVEFLEVEVAKIVAETMNGYMMFGRTLVCSYVEHEKVHPKTFDSFGKKIKVIPFKDIALRKQNKTRTAAQQQIRQKRLFTADKKRKAKLAALGIDYEYEGYTEPAPLKKKAKVSKKKSTKGTKKSKKKAAAKEEPVEAPVKKTKKSKKNKEAAVEPAAEEPKAKKKTKKTKSKKSKA